MRRVSLCFILLAGIGASRSPAATYLVRPDGTGDYPTITAAVSAATAGDVILLADGTFTGPGNRDVRFLGKSITIRSESGDPTRCIIDCQGSQTEPHRGFLFESGETEQSVLQAVTITHAYHLWGGGIHCLGNTVRARIVECIFTGNSAVQSEGGGICAEVSAAPSIEDCVFHENSASAGGAISLTNGMGGPPANIIRCTIHDNTADDQGGGVRT